MYLCVRCFQCMDCLASPHTSYVVTEGALSLRFDVQIFTCCTRIYLFVHIVLMWGLGSLTLALNTFFHIYRHADSSCVPY
jgi:hypothetical protein